MPGWFSFGEEKRPVRRRETVAGLPMLHVILPRDPKPRHRPRAAGWLKREGITMAAGHPGVWTGFPLSRYGWELAVPGPLCRRCAPALALAALEKPEEATVALWGSALTPDLVTAAHGLAPKVRQLVVAVPGGEKLARALRLRYGMPVVERGAGELTVCFSPTAPKMGALDLSGDWPRLPGVALCHPHVPAAEGWEGLSLLALLCRYGRIFPGEITAVPSETLDRLDLATYNTG